MLRFYWNLPGANELSQITATYLKIGVALTHWGWVMDIYIYISELISIGSDICLSPGHHQAIVWTNAEILLIVPHPHPPPAKDKVALVVFVLFSEVFWQG